MGLRARIGARIGASVRGERSTLSKTRTNSASDNQKRPAGSACTAAAACAAPGPSCSSCSGETPCASSCDQPGAPARHAPRHAPPPSFAAAQGSRTQRSISSCSATASSSTYVQPPQRTPSRAAASPRAPPASCWQPSRQPAAEERRDSHSAHNRCHTPARPSAAGEGGAPVAVAGGGSGSASPKSSSTLIYVYVIYMYAYVYPPWEAQVERQVRGRRWGVGRGAGRRGGGRGGEGRRGEARGGEGMGRGHGARAWGGAEVRGAGCDLMRDPASEVNQGLRHAPRPQRGVASVELGVPLEQQREDDVVRRGAAAV